MGHKRLSKVQKFFTLIIVLVIITFALFILNEATPSINFSCNRVDGNDGTCLLTTSRLFGKTIQEIPIKDINSVTSEVSNYGKNGDSCSLTIQTNSGEIVLLTSQPGQNTALCKVKQIKMDTFIKFQTQKQVEFEQKASILIYAFFIVFFLFSLVGLSSLFFKL